MGLLLFFWLFPITFLASLLSYKEIKKAMPWLGELIDKNDKIRAIVQNSLPSVAMISLNALAPFILEGVYHISKSYSFINDFFFCSTHVYPRIPCSKLDRILTSEEVGLLCPMLKTILNRNNPDTFCSS
jgi:hypothetical protein